VGWKWRGSSPIALSAFGDPVTGSTDYRLCIYDTSAGPPSLAFSAVIPAGGRCGGRPCWIQKRHGFIYFNADATPNGVWLARLQASRNGTPYIIVRGRGQNLGMPVSADGLFLLRQFPQVIVQLQRSDAPACWEAVFKSPAIHNSPRVFVDLLH
jgi:hypothetical protein